MDLYDMILCLFFAVDAVLPPSLRLPFGSFGCPSNDPPPPFLPFLFFLFTCICFNLCGSGGFVLISPIPFGALPCLACLHISGFVAAIAFCTLPFFRSFPPFLLQFAPSSCLRFFVYFVLSGRFLRPPGSALYLFLLPTSVSFGQFWVAQ